MILSFFIFSKILEIKLFLTLCPIIAGNLKIVYLIPFLLENFIISFSQASLDLP